MLFIFLKENIWWHFKSESLSCVFTGFNFNQHDLTSNELLFHL